MKAFMKHQPSLVPWVIQHHPPEYTFSRLHLKFVHFRQCSTFSSWRPSMPQLRKNERMFSIESM